MASETFRSEPSDRFQPWSEVADAPRWSIHQAKDKFSQVVRQAQEGFVQIVEDQRARDVEPVAVISLHQLTTLLGPPQERLSDLFRPIAKQTRAERIVIRPRKRKTARIQL